MQMLDMISSEIIGHMGKKSVGRIISHQIRVLHSSQALVIHLNDINRKYLDRGES